MSDTLTMDRLGREPRMTVGYTRPLKLWMLSMTGSTLYDKTMLVRAASEREARKLAGEYDTRCLNASPSLPSEEAVVCVELRVSGEARVLMIADREMK